MERRLGVRVAPDQVTACVGTKEAVTSLPHLLHLRRWTIGVAIDAEVEHILWSQAEAF